MQKNNTLVIALAALVVVLSVALVVEMKKPKASTSNAGFFGGYSNNRSSNETIFGGHLTPSGGFQSQCPAGMVDIGGVRGGQPTCVSCPQGTQKVVVSNGEYCDGGSATGTGNTYQGGTPRPSETEIDRCQKNCGAQYFDCQNGNPPDAEYCLDEMQTCVNRCGSARRYP